MLEKVVKRYLTIFKRLILQIFFEIVLLKPFVNSHNIQKINHYAVKLEFTSCKNYYFLNNNSEFILSFIAPVL
jgi:hypothetical protein